jgi:hypothetical protein
MTTPVFCSSSGSNTSPYETWAKAATSLQTAITQASSDGDEVILQYNAVPAGDAEVGVDTIYTAVAAIRLIAASNDGGADYTPTAMGTANWIGNSTTNRSVLWQGAAGKTFERVGITTRLSGSTSDNLSIGAAVSGGQVSHDINCYLWLGNTNGAARIIIGGATATRVVRARFTNCTFRFGNTAQGFLPRIGATVDMVGGLISTSGSAPSTLFDLTALTVGHFDIDGLDASNITGTVFGDTGSGNVTFNAYLRQCKFGSAATMLATQTTTGYANAHVNALDCQVGVVEGHFGYYNNFGQVESYLSSSLYLTGSVPNGGVWAITTNANASNLTPFRTPWMNAWNSTLSAITLRIEALRDGSATPFTDWEMWSEFQVKETGSNTLPDYYSTKAAKSGAAANLPAGVGTGGWTGEGGTAVTMKMELGSTVTQAYAAHMRGRVLRRAEPVGLHPPEHFVLSGHGRVLSVIASELADRRRLGRVCAFVA